MGGYRSGPLCKPIRQATGARTKEEIAAREKTEQKLKGKPLIRVPASLTKNQKKIFRFVLDQLASVQTLGKIDIPVVTQYARCADRLNELERQIDQDPTFLLDKNVTSIQDRYFKQFIRLCGELGLSPQSRAKLAISLIEKEKKSTIGDLFNDDGEDT